MVFRQFQWNLNDTQLNNQYKKHKFKQKKKEKLFFFFFQTMILQTMIKLKCVRLAYFGSL